LDNLCVSNCSIRDNIKSDQKRADFDSIVSFKKIAHIEGCVWNHADKDRGLILLDQEVAMNEEVKMMESMKAVKIDANGDTVLDNLVNAECELRMSMSVMEKKLMSKFRPFRRHQIQMPFLKIQAKVHKLTHEQILNKDVSALTFRPVNDSKFFVTKPLARALMNLLRDLNVQVVSRFPNLSNSFPTSGWDVARDLQSACSFSEADYSIHYSCDLSDAYTNCDLQDLLDSVRFCYRVVGGEDSAWKTVLIEKLASFVFKNSFVEAGGSIWVCGSMLPMGCVASGEALDTISLAGELVSLCGVLEADMDSAPAYLKNITEVITVDDYKKFRDDTKVHDSSNNIEEIFNNLRGVASGIFPLSIPITFEISIFYGSFLDCVFFKNVATDSFTTTVRLNLTAPSTWVDASSCSSTSYLTASFMSNTIRAYRISNEEKLFSQYVFFLQAEMRKANHPEETIGKIKDKVLNHVANNLCKETLRSVRVKEERKFCKPTVYSPSSGSDAILIKVIKAAYGASGQKDLVCLPARKLRVKSQNVVFTKKSHKKLMFRLAKK
jgi:hypothetical protein